METLNLGYIGCGSFASHTYPLTQRNPLYRIRAACDINVDAAKALAEKAGAAYHTADADELLADPEIDVVFITTRHNNHAELAVKAAEAKKHVYCEKPMGLSRDECRMVARAVRENGVKYCIGYNRGLAPMIAKARELLTSQSEKKMIYHRIQDFLFAEHWTHQPHIGGGRFVGEGCHIFDLLCVLVGAPPATVYAAGGTFQNGEIVKIYDSAVVTITFSDGSVCVTLIDSAGCNSFPKEATEIYCGGKAIYINNFKTMEYHGYEGRGKTEWTFDAVDKGHEIEFDLFAKSILNGGESPNGIVNAARAAVISYMVNESIASGMPIKITEDDYTF